MADDVQDRQAKRKRLWIAAAGVSALVVLLVVPPLVNLNHYQTRIASLMASSLGRPVRMSNVSVRLLPRPGFVLRNLTVEEDPAFGAEPVLHANTVTASIRLWALWRGHLELSRISVDEASVNLVRTPEGRWNIDSLFGRAAASAGGNAAAHSKRIAFLRATNSRINIKRGTEKLPFSLVETDLSFWQEKTGEWRLELKGQPARTDLNMNQGDTGLMELNATVGSASVVRQMPVRMDLQWRDAQLGQLTRLLIGRDPGWRGDLRGNMHLEGTAESAQVKARLRAVGVHREEFVPASPLDFDANCGFVYHYSAHSLENLSCDSPLGSGRAKITGQIPAPGAMQLTVELDKIPVAAGLDALRTVRNNVNPALTAAGTISGKISYVKPLPGTATEVATDKKPEPTGKKLAATEATPLTGELTVDGFQLSGAGLSQPLTAAKIALDAAQGSPATLAGTANFALGGAAPMTVDLRLSSHGYQLALHGQASVDRARELAHAGVLKGVSVLDALTGDPLAVNLTAAGPWIPADEVETKADPTDAASITVPGAKPATVTDPAPAGDSLTGTVQLHNASWQASYLVNRVQIAQATLHLDAGGQFWNPVTFSYGPLKGEASIRLPKCTGCAPQVEAEFASLDATTLQAALLGARKKGTLISELLNKLHPAAAAVWPRVDATVKAGTLTVGPVALHKATVALATNAVGVEIHALDGELLGGHAHVTGTIASGGKPAYSLNGTLENLNPAALGQLIGEHWSGGDLKLSGKLDTTGYTGDDLANSAKGSLHLDWARGAVAGEAALGKFARWIADAQIGGGKIALGRNAASERGKEASVTGSISLSLPPKADLTVSKETSKR